MSYSQRFQTKAASDEHDERIKELKEIQDGLDERNSANVFVLAARLARVVELLIEELQ